VRRGLDERRLDEVAGPIEDAPSTEELAPGEVIADPGDLGDTLWDRAGLQKDLSDRHLRKFLRCGEYTVGVAYKISWEDFGLPADIAARGIRLQWYYRDHVKKLEERGESSFCLHIYSGPHFKTLRMIK